MARKRFKKIFKVAALAAGAWFGGPALLSLAKAAAPALVSTLLPRPAAAGLSQAEFFPSLPQTSFPSGGFGGIFREGVMGAVGSIPIVGGAIVGAREEARRQRELGPGDEEDDDEDDYYEDDYDDDEEDE